jgi:hypothetical protein
MGNFVETATNVFKKDDEKPITIEQDAASGAEEPLNVNEFEVTEEHIRSNPLLGLPSDILQLIVNEIDPDLTGLAR